MLSARGPITLGPRRLLGVELPASSPRELGTRGQVGIRGSVNGVGLTTNAYPTGNGTHFVPLNRQIREQLGLRAGDVVEVVVERRPEGDYSVPPELAAAIAAEPSGAASWDGLRDGHRRTACEYVATGKTADARADLAANVVRRAKRYASGGPFWFTRDDYEGTQT